MTSDPTTAFVWIWLPGARDPVVCGRLDVDGARVGFTYARSYRAQSEAISLFAPELPLRGGSMFAASGVGLPLCIDDAMPDAWGRRLVNHRRGRPTGEPTDLVYLLESGPDRIGALGFSTSPQTTPPEAHDRPTLDDLAAAAHAIETGAPLSPALEEALLHGTSIGGARPKALLADGDRQVIAKFASSSDTYPVVQGEYVAMELARRAGLDVAGVRIASVRRKRVLLVDRFDRTPAGTRRHFVSALTVLGLSSYPDGRYATYVDLAHRIRAEFVHPDATLRGLFARIAFNMLTGNTDDHGRNHAAFVTADGLALTPAYDITPSPRSGEAAAQAMAFGPNGERQASVRALINVASVYHLSTVEAEGIVDQQRATINDQWDEVCDAAALTTRERKAFMEHQFLNSAVLG